jgi:hypothetical protein
MLGCSAAALLTVGCVVSAICSPSVSYADPAFCGAHEDAFTCTARLQSGPPTAGETAFINNVRGHVPGSDAKLLNAGRSICSMLKGGDSGQYVDTQVGSYLGMAPHSAGQVVDSATEYICPGSER